jgi:large subunit ribosomal protein L11
MAKVMNILNLEIPAGKAQPAPPLGPMLWANGVNIWQFIKEFNDKTMDMMKTFWWADVKVKAKLTIFADRTFNLEIGKPVTSNLILWKINQKSGSWEPNKKNIGKLTRKDLEEIVEIKRWDMNTEDIEAMIKIIWWTAKNMWVEVEKWAIK